MELPRHWAVEAMPHAAVVKTLHWNVCLYFGLSVRAIVSHVASPPLPYPYPPPILREGNWSFVIDHLSMIEKVLHHFNRFGQRRPIDGEGKTDVAFAGWAERNAR